MWKFLESLTPAFRHAKAQGELISCINKALDDGRIDAAAHGVKMLVAGYNDLPTTVQTVIGIVDRVEAGIEFHEHPASGVLKDRLSMAYEFERAAQARFDNSGFGKWLNETFSDPRATPPTPVDRMMNAVLRSVHDLAVNNLRDAGIVPVAEKLLHRVVQSDPERALYTAEYLAKEASPHWLGFVVPEDMAFTERYRATQPLKRMAVGELFAIADTAAAKGDLKTAFQAAAAVEKVTWDAPEWKETHEAAVAKRAEMNGRWFSTMHF